MAPTPAPDYLAKYSLNLKAGEILNITKKRRELEKAGIYVFKMFYPQGSLPYAGVY